MRVRGLPEVERIVRSCYADGLDAAAFRERLLREVRRVVPIDAAFFATCDPETLLFTSAWADAVLVPSGPRFLDSEFSDQADVNRFASLARARRPVATLDVTTEGRRARSARYREIIAPLHLGDELRVALRSGKTTWGFLCLHREEGRGFAPSEVAILERIAPHAGEALRRAVLERIERRCEADVEPAVAVVEMDQIVALTPAAAAMFDDPLAVGDAVPLAFRAVIRRLEAIELAPGQATAGARVTLTTASGALVEVHAARMARVDGPRGIALTFVRAGAKARGSLTLAAHGVTTAQASVAALVLQGLSTLQIVEALSISEYTVQDHLKAVFAKLGVSTRRELVATLR